MISSVFYSAPIGICSELRDDEDLSIDSRSEAEYTYMQHIIFLDKTLLQYHVKRFAGHSS